MVSTTYNSLQVELEKELYDLLKLKINLQLDDFNIPYLKGNNILKFEKLLEQMYNDLRCEWKKKCLLHSEPIYKSPTYSHDFYTLNNSKVDFNNGRVINYRDWEDNHYSAIVGFDGFSMFFSSRANAILNVLYIIRSMFKGSLNTQLFGDYFETILMLKNLNIEDFHIKYNFSSTLEENTDILIIEPLRYSLPLTSVDEEEIINNINNNGQLKAVIIDYTLLSNTFSISAFLKKIQSHVFIFFVKSTLELDQAGLEFSNSAQLLLYTKENPFLTEHIKKLRVLLEEQRYTLRGSLSYSEVCQLDYPTFNKDKQYVRNIMDNNKEFSSVLKDLQNIEVIHPSIHFGESCDAPFLFLSVKNNEIYSKLMEHISNNLAKYNTTIPQRNSFGFRNLSMRTIQMGKRNNVLKIAPGKINGMRQQCLLQAVLDFDKK
ncbi:hypothetical protein [Lysinibacillus sp. 54212]|uniref:hypothetical protein n=1 Tax=Lysinibacillus sp. 54212 TaxID=3119829 RepID=UPI002FC66CDE